MSLPSNIVSILSPTIPVDQGIYEESATQKARLGTRLEVGDRTFRYAKMGSSANCTAGLIVCHPLLLDSHQAGLLQCSAATTGATRLQVTVGSAVVTNEYVDGYISKATGVGMGTIHRIKAHDIMASGATTGYIELYDPIPGSVASGECDMQHCLYRSVMVDSDVTARAAGVTPIAVTTGNYFWLQTWGPAAVEGEATIAAGSLVRMDTGGDVDEVAVDGTTASAVALLNIVGKHTNLTGRDNETGPIFLEIRG